MEMEMEASYNNETNDAAIQSLCSEVIRANNSSGWVESSRQRDCHVGAPGTGAGADFSFPFQLHESKLRNLNVVAPRLSVCPSVYFNAAG